MPFTLMATEAGTVAAIADAAEIQKRLELKALLQKPYKWIDRSWDLVFWVTAIFVVGGAADITKQLFAGDWDFWTDWKDPQWWPVITAFATIIIPSALQYIQWVAWRFPTGATYTSVCFFMDWGTTPQIPSKLAPPMVSFLSFPGAWSSGR